MKIIEKSNPTDLTDKKSKFICFAFFVESKDEIKKILKDLKEQYYDASHICYAYILDNKTYYCSDGGEPSGCAGKPIYEAIKSFQLNYCLVVVVRWFGGIKFGPGPLRQAFKYMAKQTLSCAKIKDAFVSDMITISIPYSISKSIQSQFRNNIYSKKFGKDSVSLVLVGKEDEIIPKLKSQNINIVEIKKNRVVK